MWISRDRMAMLLVSKYTFAYFPAQVEPVFLRRDRRKEGRKERLGF